MKRSHVFYKFNHHPLPKVFHFLSRDFSYSSSQLLSNNPHNRHHLISLVSSSKTLTRLLQIHTQLIISGLTQDDFTNTQLIESYSLFKKVNLARLVFNGTPNAGVILWNVMIKAHIRSNQHQEAINLYNKMLNTDSFVVQPDKYTYTFVLKACTLLSDIENGVLIHEQITKRGLVSDKFIGTGLIDLYCKCGDVAHAQQVFDKMPNRDVAVWNAMVAGLSQSPNVDQAIEVFQSMQLHDRIEPNSVSLLNLFPAICKLSSIRLCKSIHGYVIKRSFSKPVMNGLIDVYSKCKRPDIAYQVFELMQEPDDISWGTIMAGLTLNGYHYQVLNLFLQMKNNHQNINIVSIITALSAAGETKDLETGKTIHDWAKKQKYDSDIRVSTPLITMYAKCDQLEQALDLFYMIPKKDIIAWSAIIAAFAQTGHPEEAISLFCDMQNAGFKPCTVTIIGVLPACSDLCSKKLGKGLHGYTIRNNIDSDISIQTSLVAMYAKCDDFASSITIFDKMSCKEIVAWNALINRYAQVGEACLAVKLFRELNTCGCGSGQPDPDPGTIVGLVSASAHLGDTKLGTSIHGLVIKYGFGSDCQVNNALIDMYSKTQSLYSAEILYGLTEYVDHVLWNVMIGGYFRHGYPKKSIFIFHQMKIKHFFRPNLATIVSILPAIACLSDIKEGTVLHAYIIHNGFLSHTPVGNSLIDMYSKCGLLEHAKTVFDEIKDKDTVSWNIMLAGYALNAGADCGYGFFTIMEHNNIKVDPVSFLSVLSACRHAGLVQAGRAVFKSMKEKHHMERGLEHYACMIDMLGRAGLFDEAMRLIGSMPMSPDAGVWGALLGACRMHNNVGLAELALDNLVRLEPENLAHFVVLSGIYAESDRWADARRLRVKMVEMGIKKTPGRSWVSDKCDLRCLEG